MKQELGGLSKEGIGSELGKNSGLMGDMFLFRFEKDHNIIQMNHNINIKKIIKNIIDKVLKRGRSIGEPKCHNQILIAAIFSSKTCQMFITFLDSEQFICTTQIHLGEDRRTIENSKKMTHSMKRIFVLPSNSIEFVAINTQMEATIFLFDKEDR
ncbi:hypothetical protein O181_083201 [Austropuccinia psidii MF-1]|uniref:Uncharacterized protein n=1 Tax=Austropuccinia psidii MF-1 TaxID=1389203 RepID=A0A9Q3FU42_9BASI|nr:hypothetical protein [Austropuccinia psidii MF-1]